MIIKNIPDSFSCGFASKKKQMYSCSHYLAAGLCVLSGLLYYSPAQALKIEPGVGAGVEYTNNASLSANNKKADSIAVGYVGASIEQNTGALNAKADTSLNYQHYTKNTFSDQHYFNLNGLLDWEMLKDRFHWLLRDNFSQRTVDSIGNNTPDNLQDTNIFTFGANWQIQASARNHFSLVPEYRKFYYEVQDTDNQQFSLATNWSYRMYPLLSVGLNASVRKVDYNRQNITDIRFSTLQLNLNGQRARSDFTLNAGATHVSRDTGEGTTGFSGELDWLLNMSNSSKLQTRLSTNLTDASTGNLNTTINPNAGDFNQVQITTDVLRNKLFHLAYLRSDGSLNSSVWTELREVSYSNTPNDRRISTLGINLNKSLMELLSGNFYADYSRIRLTEIFRTDRILTVGLTFNYQHSRKLRSALDINYRKKDSTDAPQEFSESSIFYNLVYGFGHVHVPARSSGF